MIFVPTHRPPSTCSPTSFSSLTQNKRFKQFPPPGPSGMARNLLGRVRNLFDDDDDDGDDDPVSNSRRILPLGVPKKGHVGARRPLEFAPATATATTTPSDHPRQHEYHHHHLAVPASSSSSSSASSSKQQKATSPSAAKGCLKCEYFLADLTLARSRNDMLCKQLHELSDCKVQLLDAWRELGNAASSSSAPADSKSWTDCDGEGNDFGKRESGTADAGRGRDHNHLSSDGAHLHPRMQLRDAIRHLLERTRALDAANQELEQSRALAERNVKAVTADATERFVLRATLFENHGANTGNNHQIISSSSSFSRFFMVSFPFSVAR